MPYDATVVSNNILSRSFKEKILITPMKLQKILYFAESEYQKKTSKRLLFDDFHTWAFGPVVRTVYSEFLTFSKKHINRYSRDAAGDTYVIDEQADPALRDTLDQVWEVTKYRTAVDLSEITHLEDSAWDKAFQVDAPILNQCDILNDYTYYEPLGLKLQGVS